MSGATSTSSLSRAGLPERTLDRLDLVSERRPPRVEVVAWEPPEFETALHKRNPIAVETVERGVVLIGEAFFAEAATRSVSVASWPMR